MYTKFLVLTIFLTNFNVYCSSICDNECRCRLDTNNEDFQGEIVDCSYNPSILMTEYSLPSLVHTLDLSLNNLTRVRASNILNSKTLIRLILSNNDIIEIDPNAFTTPELKILDLSYNKLEFIHEDIFKSMRNLESLNLSNNRFTTFAKLTFHKLSNLKEIILNNNDIGQSLKQFNLFDRNGFGLTHKIRNLSISGVNLNKVQENFFIEAYDLKKLDISNNNLSELFEIPYTSEYLDLSDNPITEIFEEDFPELPALKELKLNNLQITEVSDYAFASLRGLVSLELESNLKLTKFSTLAFGGQVLEDADDFLLERLSLRMSRLSTLDEQLIGPLGQLYHLDLEGNPWKCDCKLVWLKKLQIKPKYSDDLSNNDIIEIDPNAFTTPELKILDLSYNKLEFIHEDIFKSMRNLESLNLSNNRFTTFAKLTFHKLSNLKEIILNNNDIGQSLKQFNLFDRNGFGLTHKIRNLSISGVNLNKVQENFFIEAYDLKKLDISNNNLSELFEIPYTSEYLDLSDNPITEIFEEDFPELPALKELKLNNLQITEVSDYAFASLRGLVSLELESNLKLTKFSTLAFGGQVLEDADDFLLERLSLRMSRLSTLDEQLIGPLGQLYHLDLEGNPWKCDCKLVWLKKLQIKPKYSDDLRCATPRPLLNKRIFDIDEKSFVCTINSHYIGIAIAGISLCVILFTIALWLCLFLPRYQSRCHFLQNMYTPSTAYVLLPTVRTHHL